MNMDIREALSKLDTLDDDQWTGDGAPKIDAVKELLGHPVTRQEIVNAAPKFNRENPIVEDEIDPELDPMEEIKEVDRSGVEAIAAEEPMEVSAFLMALSKIPSDQLDDVMQVLKAQEQAVIEHRKRAEEMALRVRQAMMYTKVRIQREVPDIDNQKAIREYLESQQRTRAAKHALTHAVLKGIDLKQLDPRAAIDRAMARKTQRGTQRPIHPSR
jgi:hypothetical protein